jgi:hypothetical protein
MADDLAVFFGHDGKRQFASVAQCTHDELLRVAGVRRIGEGGNGHGLDGAMSSGFVAGWSWCSAFPAQNIERPGRVGA